MPTTKITEARVADIATIQHLAYRIWPVTYNQILSEAQTAYMLSLFYDADALEQQMLGGQQFLLIHENEQTIGFAAYQLHYPQPHQAKLHKLYVLPETQGKGIGQQLVQEIMIRVKQENQKSLILNVNIHNQALHFYEKLHFKIVDRVDIEIGESYFMNDYVMQLDLQ